MTITALPPTLSRLCLKYSSKSNNVIFHLALRHYFASSASWEWESNPSHNPALYEFLVHTHHFSPKSASQIASLRRTRFTDPEKSDTVISFLKERGFSSSQLENTVKGNPQLVSANLDKIKPKFIFLQDLGLSRTDVAEIISKNPHILTRSLNDRIIPNLSLVKNLLGSDDRLMRIMKAGGGYLFRDMHNSLVPNVELLTKYGVSMDQILRMVHHFPRFLLRKHEAMKKFAATADAMGISRSSKLFIHALRVISSMSDETRELKLRTFRGLGFSDDDVAAMFRKQPWFLGLSREKIKKTKELLLATGKYNLFNIVGSPKSLQHSTEKRYKPRLKVLQSLEGKKLIHCWPTLSSLCTMTDKKFVERYVAPFWDEIGDVYIAKSTADVK